jgi:hypothetical protein
MHTIKISLVFVFAALICICAGCASTGATGAAGDDAIVLFDGSNLDEFVAAIDGGEPGWRIVDGALEVVPGSGSIETKRQFSAFTMHLEFMIPESPDEAKGQWRGNSGVYIQRRYEVQILDSFGVESGPQDCGAIYKAKIPDRNVCEAPGQWQTYDITFQPPTWDTTGDTPVKTHNARITVVHNGVMIHDDFSIPNKTGAGEPEGPAPGPILLQDHGAAVRFRNITITPID